MSKFRDADGNSWYIQVDVSAIKRVKTLIGVDLLELGDKNSKLFETLISNPVVLCNTIYSLCKPQADKENKTDEQFGAAMRGDAIADAVDAFLEGMADFFPAPKRALWKKLIEKMKTAEKAAMEMAEKKMNSPETDAAILQSLKNSGESFIAPPESSASIPTH